MEKNCTCQQVNLANNTADQEPLRLINVIEDDCYYFGCTYKGHQLDVRFGALLECLQIIFLSNHLALNPQKSHECALK